MAGFQTDPRGKLYVEKDADAVLDYKLDWTDWLAEDNDLITGVLWVIDDGLTYSNPTNTAKTATIWLADGEPNGEYNVTCRISTAAGRTADRSFRVMIIPA